MDFAYPPKSPFGPPDPDLTFPDLDDPPPTKYPTLFHLPTSSKLFAFPSKPSTPSLPRIKSSWHKQRENG
jgi:hypothetical protein